MYVCGRGLEVANVSGGWQSRNQLTIVSDTLDCIMLVSYLANTYNHGDV